MSSSQAPAIVCSRVWKIFGDRPIEALRLAREGGVGKSELMKQHRAVVGLADVSLEIARGEIFCVMGLSGSGKSTLVRHFNGLIKPTDGKILIDGDDLSMHDDAGIRRLRAEKMGMVFQNFALLPHRNVIENVAFGLELRGAPRDDRLARARDMLKIVQLDGWDEAWPDELSGGMQQRVGLARALAGRPQILLMDEPFGALDPLIRRQLQEEFLTLVRAMNMTTVFITHDLDEALRIGTRIAVMRDGAIVQTGTPADILRKPADDYVSAFTRGISPMKVLEAGDLMTDKQLPKATKRLPRVSRHEKAATLATLLESHETVLVVNDSGGVIGSISRSALLGALSGSGT